MPNYSIWPTSSWTLGSELDAIRPPTALEQDNTIIAVVEMSEWKWLVAALVPGIERQLVKKVDANDETLLKLLHRWRQEAGQAGRNIKRIVVAFESSGHWSADWLRERDIEAYVIHPTGIAEHRRANTDRLDTELLMRVLLGWLRGSRAHMAAVLKAFGPLQAIAEFVGPDWGVVSEPDLFDRPTRTEAVARYIEHRINAAGRVYWKTLYLPTVAETRDLLEDFQAKLDAVHRIMRRVEHARNAFNSAWPADREDWPPDTDAEDGIPDQDKWEHLRHAIEDGWERAAFLLSPDVNVGKLLEQPPTDRKEPERVLWEALFALLRECGIEPLEQYQPLIHTLRAVHSLLGIDKRPNPGSVGYVKSEFLKENAGGGGRPGVGLGGEIIPK
jgi:hypothetical protein